MAPTLFAAALAAVLFTAVSVSASEIHTIRFNNQCGEGTPKLIIDGTIVSNGSDYTISGQASGIAYLQTGDCGFNGDECTLMEFYLGNPDPSVPGSGTSSDISLISPHALNVPLSFSYFDGCDGQGAYCASDSCTTAFFKSDDNQVQVACQTDNVNLLIAFCTDATSSDLSSSSASSASSTHTSASVKTTTASSTSVSASVAASATVAAVPVNVAEPASDSSSAAAASAAPSSAATIASAVTSVAATPSASSSSTTCKKRRAERTARSDSGSRAVYESHRRLHARQLSH